MSVIFKTVGKKRYAYLAKRAGTKVIHTYLGPADSPDVIGLINRRRDLIMLPDRFSSLFWDVCIKNINIKKNANYIIERILEYGDLDAIAWMQQVYAWQTIIDVLLISRSISAKSRNFWELWFGVTHA
ncbi:MAG: hypothetical protein L0Y62_02020 [Nitrospirae bacterium]|nr:hypothetical protein [Nitrospirota bacterium]